MSSLYAIRTVGALIVVDVATGLALYAPFTISPAGQPEWRPAVLTRDDAHSGKSRTLSRAADFDDIAFTGGRLRFRDRHDIDVVLWCIPVHAQECHRTEADLLLVGGYVFTRSLWGSFVRMQPAGANTGTTRMSYNLDRFTGDAPILAFQYPRGFIPVLSPPELAVLNRRESRGGGVTLLVTASGSVHAMRETGQWLKLTARKGMLPAGSDEWRSAYAVAVPPDVIETAATVTVAVQHPDTRTGIENVRVGDHAYIYSRHDWTLTTPVVRIFSGALTDEVPEDDDGAFVVAGPEAAWLVEQGTLLPIHDDEPLPAPLFMALGDRLEHTTITHIVRLDEP